MDNVFPCPNSAYVFESLFHNNVRALKKLLKSGIDPNICDAIGDPLLFTPIVYGDVEALKRLLPYTDVNIENRDCRTPLILAVEMGDIDIAKMLIKAGARVDCRDSSGKTPLLLALENGNFKIAEYLIKHGSDVNDIDDLGQSGLHLIVTGGHTDCARIVKILFKCGYVMKDVDNWLSPEDLVANPNLQYTYFKLIQDVKAVIKVNSMESLAIPRECFESRGQNINSNITCSLKGS